MNATDLLLPQKLLSREKRHESYVGIPSERERCYRPSNVNESAEDSCNFVWNNPNCRTLDPLIEYLRILVCYLEIPNSVLGTIFIIFYTMVFVVIYSLFILLPNSLVLLKRMKMKEYTFGAGVLALIFTIPTIMSNILTCFSLHRNYSVLYSAGVGKTLHCLLLGLSLICIFAQGKIEGATLMRDIGFTAVGSTFAYAVMYREMHNLRKMEHQRSKSFIHIASYISLIVYIIYLVNVLVFSKREVRKSSTVKHLSGEQAIKFSADEQNISIPSSSESLASDEYEGMEENPIENDVDAMAVFLISISPFHNIEGSAATKFLLFLAFWGLCVGFLLTTIIEIEWLVLNWQIMNYVFDWTDDAILLLIFPALYVFLVSVFVLTLLNEDRVAMAFGLVMGLVLIHAYSAMPVIAFSACFVVDEFVTPLISNAK
uniref:Uncharacterized protein n=1 Tax=Glossina austeni TaxID=7395 RepID=A0A1A9V1A0_GLOAU